MTTAQKSIAFVTATTTPAIPADDHFLVEALSDKNIQCIAAPWDDPTINWSAFDLVLIRACWNYHRFPNAFQSWLTSIEKQNINIVNHPEQIVWNMNKRYLQELNRNGIPIPHTEWLQKNDFYPEQLHDVLLKNGWNKAVVKPCISASSFRTNIITLANAPEAGKSLAADFPEGGMMMQQFMDVIPEQGELSLIFFNKKFSHAVIKTAQPGDFRVQHEFGGRYQEYNVSDTVISQAMAVLEYLSHPPVFARVDGILVEDQFYLMELELIEPVLFFGCHKHAAERLAAAIMKSW